MSIAKTASLVLPLVIRGADSSPLYHSNIVQVPLGGRVGYAIVALLGLSGLVWCLGEFTYSSSHSLLKMYDADSLGFFFFFLKKKLDVL
jgi:hypothetical protein